MTWLRSLFVVLIITSTSQGEDWPQWLGAKRDGTTSEKITPWKEAPKVVWRANVEKGFSCPVVAQGRVYIHAPAVKGKNAEEVICFDAVTGDVLWRDMYERAPYGSKTGVGPRATPTVVGNRVYTFGITGVLTCYAADSGKKHWQVDTYKQLDQKTPGFGVCCSPLVIGNVVLVSVGGKGSCIAAYDIEKGELIWKGYDEPASTSSPVLFAPPGQPGKLPDVVFMTTLRLLAVNPLDGSLSWEFPLVFQPSGASTTPLVVGEHLVTSTMSNGTTDIQISPKGDKRVAAQQWQKAEMTGYFSTGVAADKERLYLVTNIVEPTPKCMLRCVDLKSGKELWNKDNIGYYHAGLLLTGDNQLLVLNDAGTLSLAHVDAQGYRELASAKVSGGTFSMPALANGRLYVRDDKELICLEFAR